MYLVFSSSPEHFLVKRLKKKRWQIPYLLGFMSMRLGEQENKQNVLKIKSTLHFDNVMLTSKCVEKHLQARNI